MQRVEIIRALLTNPKLLILDEPTSVLTPQAVEKLFVTCAAGLEGCSILYISHKLHEIRALCTACTVLRGGKVTGVTDPRQESQCLAVAPDDRRRAARAGAPRAQPARWCWRCRQLTCRAKTSSASTCTHRLRRCAPARWSASPACRATASASCCMRCRAKTPAPRPMRAVVVGQAAGRFGPARAARWACTSCPRNAWAAAPCRRWAGAQPAAHAHRRRRPAAAGSNVKARCRRRRRHHPPLQRQGRRAAGGGQVAVGRQPAEVHRRPRDRRQAQAADRLAADLGRRRGRGAAQIRGEILALRDAGCAVLVVSEELEELFEICDRLHVIAKGRLSPSLPRAEATVEQIGEWMSGLWTREDGPRMLRSLKLEAAPSRPPSGATLAAAGAG
jgi:hypothetical protein